MSRMRLFSAGATSVVLCALVVAGAAPIGAAVPDDIPAACPAGTVQSVSLLRDDFDPTTAPSTTWDLAPRWRTLTEPTFGAVQKDGAEGDTWRFHVDNPAKAGRVGTDGGTPVDLPAGRRLLFEFRHAHHFPYTGGADGAPIFPSGRGAVFLVPPGGRWNTNDVAKSFYADSHGLVTTVLDASALGGQTMVPRFALFSEDMPVGASTGWDIDDVAIYTCDAATPSAPVGLTASGGLGRADLTWNAPTWSGTSTVTGYRITVSPGGEVYTVSADTTNATVTGLTNGIDYKFDVQTLNEAGAGAPARAPLHGTRLSISSKTINYGASATVAGKLTYLPYNDGLTDSIVELQTRKPGTNTWSHVANQTTTHWGGEYSFTVAPTSSREYRTVYTSGTSYTLGTTSGVGKVNVRQVVTGRWADSTIRRGQTAKFSGSVAPNHRGQTIYLQRLVDDEWRIVTSTKLSSTSTYSFARTFYKSGTYQYRTYRPADAGHAAGFSPSRTLKVS